MKSPRASSSKQSPPSPPFVVHAVYLLHLVYALFFFEQVRTTAAGRRLTIYHAVLCRAASCVCLCLCARDVCVIVCVCVVLTGSTTSTQRPHTGSGFTYDRAPSEFMFYVPHFATVFLHTWGLKIHCFLFYLLCTRNFRVENI